MSFRELHINSALSSKTAIKGPIVSDLAVAAQLEAWSGYLNEHTDWNAAVLRLAAQPNPESGWALDQYADSFFNL